MTDRPIIFSAPMVRALLDGRKTQTRRLIKQWRYGEPSLPFLPGDRLYVREVWRVGAWREDREDISGGRGDCPVWGDLKRAVAIDYLADSFAQKEWLTCDNGEMMKRLVDQSCDDAEADGRFTVGTKHEYRWSPGQSPCRLRSPIHMPRWASRITLTVTEVRVQRLQDISEEDVLAEGCPIDPDYRDTTEDGSNPHMVKVGTAKWVSPRAWYHQLWNSLHGPDAWDANPWVVAVSFTVARRNIDR